MAVNLASDVDTGLAQGMNDHSAVPPGAMSISRTRYGMMFLHDSTSFETRISRSFSKVETK